LGRYLSSSLFWKFMQKKNETSAFLIRTEQASSIKDLLLWLFTNLRTAKHVSISKCATKTEKGNKQFS